MKKVNVPTIFIVFGATGDLMTRKIVPSLFYLYKNMNKYINNEKFDEIYSLATEISKMLAGFIKKL